MDREIVLKVLKWKRQGYELVKEVMPDQVQQCINKTEARVKDVVKAIVMDIILNTENVDIPNAGGAINKDRINKTQKVDIEL